MPEHVHRWLCGVGTTPVHGVCACGAERDFTNAESVSNTGKQQMVIKPRRFVSTKAEINPGYWAWKGELGRNRFT